MKPARDTGSSDFFEWQSRQGRSGRGVLHAHASPAPLPAARADSITVEEHHASTTIVEKIREALIRKIRRGE